MVMVPSTNVLRSTIWMRGLANLLSSPCSKMLPLRFRRCRRFAEIDCVVFSPRQTHPRKARVAAYVDEGCIYYFQQRTRSCPTQPIKPREYHPYIAALLIALAQTTYRGEEVDHVEVGLLVTPLPCMLTIQETSVLFSENPRGFSKEPVREFHLYSASIPLALLKFFQRPKAILPAYDTMSVTCVSIPVEPLASLRERIVIAMPDSALDQQSEEEMTEQLETHRSNSLPVESQKEY